MLMRLTIRDNPAVVEDTSGADRKEQVNNFPG